MSEKSKVPSVLSRTGNDMQFELVLGVPEACVWFEGHFDEAPILSGVAQLDWVMHFAKLCWSDVGDFRGVEVLKFQNVIQPGDQMIMRLTWDKNNNKLRFSMSGIQEKPFSSGRILLKSRGEEP